MNVVHNRGFPHFKDLWIEFEDDPNSQLLSEEPRR